LVPIPSVKSEHQFSPKTSTPPQPSTPLTSNKRSLKDRTVPSPETPARQPHRPGKRTRKFTKKAINSSLNKVLKGHKDRRDKVEKTGSKDDKLPERL